MRLLFFYNPKSGHGNASDIQHEIRDLLGSEHTCNFVHIDDLAEVDKTLPYDAVVAIGGDGTVNTVAECCKRHNKPLGIIPRGSGDGLARHLHIPKDLKAALDLILQGHTQRVDTATINGHFFANVAGTGFEAVVAHEFGEMGNKRGFWGYFRAIRRLYFSYEQQSAELSINEQSKSVEFFSLTIANGSQWGNDFEIASKASLTDGVLELALMKKPKWYQILTLIRSLRRKTQLDSSWLTYVKAQEFRIRSNELRWHIDGEPLICDAEVEIKVQAATLSIFTPHG